MPIKRLSQSSLLTFEKYSSMLAGNDAYQPYSDDYEWLETTILPSNQASVIFSNLNANYGSSYQHLQIRATQRSSVADNGMQAIMRFNGDGSPSSYAMHQFFGNGSNAVSEGIGSGILGGLGPVGRFPGANATANTFGAVIIDILDPFKTTKNTTVRAFGGQSSTEKRIHFTSGLWLNTDAITSIYIQPQDGSNFVMGSRFSLYGLRST